jgi:hypothetical protein
MGEERIASAIARLEQALARLEAASARRPSLTSFDKEEGGELRERHEALRGKVEGAIARIDSLLQSAERS